MKRFILLFAILALLIPAAFAAKKPGAKSKPKEPSALDKYVQEAMHRAQPSPLSDPGSTWSPASRLVDIGSDVRANQVDDMVTVLVSEKASAVSQGTTTSSRKSSVSASIPALAGVTRAAGPWANLAKTSNDTQLAGNGVTSRQTTLSTTLSTRVTNVLPNGYLVIEGHKEVQVNAEQQIVTVRGVVRPVDLTPGNVVVSDSVAQLEIHINGKGVVNDAIRRPFFLYRLLLGLLPF